MDNLKATLNVRRGVGILVTTLLGSGIFIVPAIVATEVGILSIFCWALIIILMIPIAITFGDLGAKYPDSSGVSFFVESAFGKSLGKIISILYLSVIPIGPPVVIITGATYLASAFGVEKYIPWICLGSIVAMLLINTLGMQVSTKVQGVLSIICLTAFIAIIFIGIYNLQNYKLAVDTTVNSNNYANIFPALATTFWCFVGIEAVSHLAGEFKNVKRDFPKTIIISILIVGLLYLFIGTIIFLYNAYGTPGINDNSLVYLLNIFLGNTGKLIIGVIGFITCLLASNLYILSSSRLLMSLNKNNKISTVINGNVPIYALIISYLAVLTTIFIKFKYKIDLSTLINYANGVFILIYVFTMLAGIKLLKNSKKTLSFISFLICIVFLLSIGKHALYGIVAFWVILLVNTLYSKYKTTKISIYR